MTQKELDSRDDPKFVFNAVVKCCWVKSILT